MTAINEPVANMIDGNVKLGVLSHIPDIFQDVAEVVFDRLPKSPRVMTLLQIYLKETQLSSFGANNVEHHNTFDLRTEDLSTKGLERLHGK